MVKQIALGINGSDQRKTFSKNYFKLLYKSISDRLHS